MAEYYYYGKMSREDKAVYHAILDGLMKLSASFSVPRTEGRNLADIFFLLRLDHPEVFWVENYSCRYYQDSTMMEFKPVYLFEKKKVQEHQKAMNSRVEKLVRAAKDLSDQEKLLYVHDFICKNVRYDKLKKAYSHEIIGPLGQGVGVCEGIAKSVKVLLDALGIWCMIPLCGNNPEKGIKYRHVWNVVRLGGKYYHLDATFDGSLSSEERIRYDYFLLSDEKIFRDHEPVLFKIPACTDNDLFYYRQKKLSFTKYEEVRKRTISSVKKGKELIFHYRGGYLTREVLKDLLQIMEEEAAKKDRHIRLSLNWPQAVLDVTFPMVMPEEQVELEEANEGELN